MGPYHFAAASGNAASLAMPPQENGRRQRRLTQLRAARYRKSSVHDCDSCSMTYQETISGLNRPIHHTARDETGRHSYGGPIRWRPRCCTRTRPQGGCGRGRQSRQRRHRHAANDRRRAARLSQPDGTRHGRCGNRDNSLNPQVVKRHDPTSDPYNESVPRRTAARRPA
jgi:hypothetical protein